MQFLENVHPLPVFCALDSIVPATRGVLGDYNFLHRTRDLRSPRKLLPYWGPGWYWRAETEWMLDVGIVTWEDVRLTFTASAHIPPSFLADRLRRLDELWAASQRNARLGDKAVESKHALNSMFGIWGILQHYAYRLQVADDPDDVVASAVRKTPTPGYEPEGDKYLLHDYVTRTELKSYASMRPIHQICLSQERLVMAKMAYVLEHLEIPRRLLSIRNDGASIQPGRRWEAVKEVLGLSYGALTRLQDAHESLRRCVAPRLERQSSSETPVFRFKEHQLVTAEDGSEERRPLEPDWPGGELAIRDGETPELPDLTWQVEEEPESGEDDFYERVVRPRVVEQQQPLLLTGPAGVGKSEVLRRLDRDLQAQGHTVAKITLTHVACRRLDDARTAHHFVIRHVLNGSFRGWVLIDEIGMLPAVLLTLLENLHILQVKFVMFGDWNQLSPPMNHWRAATLRPDAFRQSRLLHLWAGGAEFRLTRCRRSNREHFDFCLRILDLPLRQAVEEARRAFPRTAGAAHEHGEMHLVLSHSRRVELNALCQHAAAARYRERYPDAPVYQISADGEEKGLNLQQDFEIFPGTRLIGCNTEAGGVVNGGFLRVTAVDLGMVDVCDEQGKEFRLSYAQVARSTRLAWAITITASQSREFDCKVCIWDADSRHFSKEHLYTALTRVKIGTPGCSLVVA